MMPRMPAERAYLAKRLGHVQAGLPILAVNAPTSALTQLATTPSSNPIVPASVSHPASSAPSVFTTHSSSSSTSSTSSVASSAPLHSLTTALPPASIVTPADLTPTSTTSSPTLPPSNAAAASQSGLSGGAIAGIIAGVAVVSIALIMFLVRKTALRRRARRRVSWSGAPGMRSGIFDETKHLPDTSEPPVSLISAANPQWVPPPSPFEPHGQSRYSSPALSLAPLQPTTYPPYAAPTPFPETYNNPSAATAYPSYPVPMTYGPGNVAAFATARVPANTGIPSTLSPTRPQQGLSEATVRCTFIPTLPDELSITTGERIFIIEEYDDGWGLCANVRGERGMVPRECLEHAPINQSAVDWRHVGRSSSLNPEGNRY